MYISRSKSTKDQYWNVVYRYFISANETKGQIRTDRIRKTTGKKKQEKQNDIVTKMSKPFILVVMRPVESESWWGKKYTVTITITGIYLTRQAGSN